MVGDESCVSLDRFALYVCFLVPSVRKLSRKLGEPVLKHLHVMPIDPVICMHVSCEH